MSRQTQRAVTQDAVKAIQDSNSERAQEEWARKDEEAELTTGDGHEDEAMHTLLPPSRTGEEKGKLRSAGKKKEPNAIPLRIGESGLRRKRRASSVARMSGTSVSSVFSGRVLVRYLLTSVYSCNGNAICYANRFGTRKSLLLYS